MGVSHQWYESPNHTKLLDSLFAAYSCIGGFDKRWGLVPWYYVETPNLIRGKIMVCRSSSYEFCFIGLYPPYVAFIRRHVVRNAQPTVIRAPKRIIRQASQESQTEFVNDVIHGVLKAAGRFDLCRELHLETEALISIV